jgi:hypothetical protein
MPAPVRDSDAGIGLGAESAEFIQYLSRRAT